MRLLKPSTRLAGLLVVVSTLALTACEADSQDEPNTIGRTAQRRPNAAPSPPGRTIADPREAPGASCLRSGDQARLVHFGPQHGLGGYLIGSGSSYVVLAHQLGGNSCQLLPLAERLAGAGYRAFAFDSAGVASSRPGPLDGHRVSDDVLAAVVWARARGAVSVALVGASKGGYGVLDAALRARPPVDAVVSLSAPSAWDDPTGRPLDIAGMTTPTQLWASRQDSGIGEAARGYARQDPAADLHLEAGAAHGVELVPVAFGRIRDFLDAHRR